MHVVAKIGTNKNDATWWPKLELMQVKTERETLPEAQRTQGIDSVSLVISKVEIKTSCRDYSRYGVNTLGPLCLWQCFVFHSAQCVGMRRLDTNS